MFRKKAIVIFLSAFVVFGLVGCGHKKTASTPETPKSTISSSTAESNSNQDISVDTPYGKLVYPYSVEEILTTESNKADDTDSYIFDAVFDENKIKVFTIYFSKSDHTDEGDLIGTTKDKDGNNINVYLKPESNIVNEEMSDDEKDIIYTAQETLNDVVTSLEKWPDYKSKQN